MKKLAIIVFLFTLVIGIRSSFAHQEVITKALKPVPRNPAGNKIPFLLPQKFIQMGAKNSTLAATEELFYYNIDPTDNTTYTYMDLPYYYSDGGALYAYGERFTSLTMKSFTVDSFTVTLGAINFEVRPGNRILFTLRKKLTGSTNPNIFPAFTFIDSTQILPADLPPSDTATTFTLPFSKKVKPKLTSSAPDFWIFAELPDTVGNNIRMLADATKDDPANHGNPRPDEDRSYDYFVRNDSTFVSFLGGTFQNTQTSEIYYNQMAITAYISGTALGVDDAKLEGNALAQNYPNPFNPSTEIRYSLEKQSNVSLKVYNALGLEVATLVDGSQSQGEHNVSFNADNLPTGTYFYTLKTGTFSQTKRMVLSK